MADWAKLYVTLRDDPKWLRSSDKARVAYVEALCWTAQHETDGALVESLFSPKVLAELVTVGFVDEAPDGFVIHAYGKRQRTKSQLDAVRSAGRKANAIRWGSVSDSKTLSESDSDFDPEVEVEVEVEKEQAKARTSNLAPRKRDALFEVVAEVCGIDWHELTQTSRGALNKAVAQLRPLNPDPDDVRLRASNWPYDVPLTPPALAKHWPALSKMHTPKPKNNSVSRALSMAADLERGTA